MYWSVAFAVRIVSTSISPPLMTSACRSVMTVARVGGHRETHPARQVLPEIHHRLPGRCGDDLHGSELLDPPDRLGGRVGERIEGPVDDLYGAPVRSHRSRRHPTRPARDGRRRSRRRRCCCFGPRRLRHGSRCRFDDLGVVGIFEDELGEERGAVSVVVALVLPPQPAQRPPFSHDRAEHIAADDKIVGHVVFRDHQTVPIRRPPRG